VSVIAIHFLIAFIVLCGAGAITLFLHMVGVGFGDDPDEFNAKPRGERAE